MTLPTPGWHEASNDELLNLPPDTPVMINGKHKERLGDYQELRLPGNYPFLIGMANGFGWIVEVPDA